MRAMLPVSRQLLSEVMLRRVQASCTSQALLCTNSVALYWVSVLLLVIAASSSAGSCVASLLPFSFWCDQADMRSLHSDTSSSAGVRSSSSVK